MDPNETLTVARRAYLEWCAEFDGKHRKDELADLGETLAEAFHALDSWLSKGGLKPEAWEPDR